MNATVRPWGMMESSIPALSLEFAKSLVPVVEVVEGSNRGLLVHACHPGRPGVMLKTDETPFSNQHVRLRLRVPVAAYGTHDVGTHDAALAEVASLTAVTP